MTKFSIFANDIVPVTAFTPLPMNLNARSTISRALKSAGVTVSCKVTERPGLVARVLQMYAGGMHAKAIGAKLGITPKSVSKILHDNGVRTRHSSEYSN